MSKEQVFHSAELEKMAASLVAGWYKICEEATEDNLWHECTNFWFGIRALNRLSVATNNARGRPGASGFSAAMTNEMNRVAQYIKSRINVDPRTEWKTF